VGFENQAQYWPTFNGNVMLTAILKARATTTVSTGSNCKAALKSPTKPEVRNSTLYSDTTGTCCLTNDLMYLACYACFDCAGLLQYFHSTDGANTLNFWRVSFHSCNAATGVWQVKNKDTGAITPGLGSAGTNVRLIDIFDGFSLYGWFQSCPNTKTYSNGVTLRYQPDFSNTVVVTGNYNNDYEAMTNAQASCVPK
jgi:hypothetical protein